MEKTETPDVNSSSLSRNWGSEKSDRQSCRTSWTEIKTLTGYEDWVRAVSFSPDGKLLATGYSENNLRLWRLDFDYLLHDGCNFIGNYLKPNPNDAESLEIDRELCRKLPKNSTSNRQYCSLFPALHPSLNFWPTTE